MKRMGDPNGALVDAVGSALRHGGNTLSVVPNLLKQLLEEGAWRDFTTQLGRHVQYERFAEFAVTPPLAGLGTDVALIRRIVAADTEATDMLDRALQGKQGERTDLVDNVIEVHRPTGNSRDRALRKLRRDEPELHAQVLAGELTAHAAMVQAGHRPATFTVRADSPESIAETLRRRFTPEQCAVLAQLLTQESA